MARKPREEVEDGIFHVYARGNNKSVIYLDDADRTIYVRLLEGAVRQRRWYLLAYCLMNNHLHLLIETPETNLGAGMQQLHTLYALRFNRRHGRSGHVFQGRYGAVRITTDEQLWMAAAYVAANPVAAGLCGSAEEWRWGSYAAVAGGSPPDWLAAGRLLGYFGAAGGDGWERYVDLVRHAGSPAGAGLPEEGARGVARGAASR
jgi:putative transposase